MMIKSLLYKLWLSIIAISHTNLSMNIYYIKSSLKILLKSSKQNLNLLNQRSKIKTTQLEKQRKKNIIKIAIEDDKAYWVFNNVFYESDVVDGYVDGENSRPIDAHTLSNNQIEHLLTILDGINSK